MAMGGRVARKKPTEDEIEPKNKVTEDEIEEILGLFLLAFGEGVDGLHVKRKAVRQIRDRFKPYISSTLETQPPTLWKKESATVLGWMLCVGRLAGQIAMRHKRTVINARDVRLAIRAVIDEHEVPHIEGHWCT